MRILRAIGITALLCVSAVCASAQVVLETAPGALAEELSCGPAPPRRINDYRTRIRDLTARAAISDIERYHLNPALEEMRAENYSRGVLHDLSFVLNWWPNHVPALRALIQYELAGGRIYDQATAECRLVWASQLIPDDINVVLTKAYYYWKLRKLGQSLKAYEIALSIDPDSIDAHYGIGLVYFELSDYEKSAEHAREAYVAGYPLPGLKNKLESVGQWRGIGKTN